MRIDGKALANEMLTKLTREVKQLSVAPTLAVILVGDNPDSLSYIRQKQKATEKIGGKFIFEQLPAQTLPKELSARIAMYNNDPSVHGLIVQRPLPSHIDVSINQRIAPHKDVDGFVQNSPFKVPVVMAIFTLLRHIHCSVTNKHIVIVGRGETAGGPIAAAFTKQQCATSVITRNTPRPNEILKKADIIISCVGKEKIITPTSLTPGVVLISVGITKGEENKLHGDYEENAIKNIASFYTPTPGGVGPLNIASLMQNLVHASQNTR